MLPFDFSGLISLGTSHAPASVFLVLGAVIGGCRVFCISPWESEGDRTIGMATRRIMIPAARAELGEVVLVPSADGQTFKEKL